MKLAATALVLLFSLGLPEGAYAATAREQTDWYSRGIIRQQTIRTKTTRKKQPQHSKRKKRQAHTTPHRANSKPASVKN
jgi:hypothetical protein